MSWRSGHPHPERLASFRAGMVRASQGRRLSAHVSRCSQCALICARLDTISAALAAAPLPVLPSATERQVIASLQGESATREAGTLSAAMSWATRPRLPEHSMSLLATGPTDPAGQSPAFDDRRLVPARSECVPGAGARSDCAAGMPARDGAAARSNGRVPRGDGLSALVRGGAVAFVLALLVSMGYLVRGSGLAHGASAHSSPSPSGWPAPRTLAAGGAAAAATLPGGPAADRVTQGDGRIGGPPRTAIFAVSETGTKYRRSTLRAQVRRRIAAAQAPGQETRPPGPVIAPATDVPAPPGVTGSSSPGSKGQAGRSPHARVDAASAALVGCVLRLTGGILPELVDRATYQARPAYVIEAHDEIWVVGIGCTATRSELMVAVRFYGAA